MTGMALVIMTLEAGGFMWERERGHLAPSRRLLAEVIR
jgi:hypothetical protein